MAPSRQPTNCQVASQPASQGVDVDILFDSTRYSVANACAGWIQAQAETGQLWYNVTVVCNDGTPRCQATGGELTGPYAADPPNPPAEDDVCELTDNGTDAYVFGPDSTGVQSACAALLAAGGWTEDTPTNPDT
jgi:hypothetical protein